MKTILIADNTLGDPSQLEKMAQAEGFRLIIARDGVEAQRRLEHLDGEVKVVIVDWDLPQLNGLELLEWIRSQPELAHVEVIIQSDGIDLSDVRKGIDRGAYRFLRKPYPVRHFQAVVKAAVTDSQVRQSLSSRLQVYENAIDLLSEGFFEIRTPSQAQALAIGIARFCNRSEHGLGLHELLLNSVEHGNLGIGYDDKSRLLQKGHFEEEVRRRLASPQYRDRRVRVRITRKEDGLEVLISDEGPGFDFSKYDRFDPSRLLHSHGRGVLMASTMLSVEYLDPGNKVLIRIPNG